MAQVSEDIRRHLADLYSQPGVSGSCLQVGGLVITHDLPYSDERIANLVSRVDHLIGSYDSVGRQVWQLCAGFENFWLMILCRGTTRLTLLLKTNADLDLIAGRATRLLMDVDAPLSRSVPAAAVAPAPKAPAPVGAPGSASVPAGAPSQPTAPPPASGSNGSGSDLSREEFEKLMVELISRVTGQSQAAKLIQMELSKYPGMAMLSKENTHRIGLAILEYIPNRGKRSALAQEFNNTLNS